MIKLTIRKVVLFVFSALILSGIGSCKKDTDVAGKSRTELITQSVWKIVKHESKSGSAAWVDDTSTFLACEKDNNFIFRSDMSYEINEGPTKCSAADPQIYETGVWSFQNNEMQLTLTDATGPVACAIDQLDENTLMVTSSYTGAGGVIYLDRSTFGH